jgi:hypothetical protein
MDRESRLQKILKGMTRNERALFLIRYAEAHRMRKQMGKKRLHKKKEKYCKWKWNEDLIERLKKIGGDPISSSPDDGS